MSEPTKEQLFVKNMQWMINSGEEAESMSTPELLEALCELDGGRHVSSLESAIVGEVVYRLQHPNTWRIRRWCFNLKCRYDAWKYCRRNK